jgi:hypothetical protein
VRRTFAANAYPFAIAAAVFVVAVGLPSTDSDTYWQIASGLWMLDHGQLLRNDVFSSTVFGAHLGIGDWLGQLIFAAAFKAGGWAGVAVLRATVIAVASFFVVRLARRGGTPWWISFPLAIAALLASKITWTDRPQLFTLAFVPLVLDLLYDTPASWSRRLLVLPPLFAVWASIHGGYILGLIILAIFSVHALVTERRKAAPLLAVALASAAATFVNPAPLDIAGAAVGVAPPRFIEEYLPPDVLSPAGAIFAAFVLGVLGAALMRGGTLLDALLLVPLLSLGLSAQRHMVFFCVAALPFVGPRLRDLRPRLRVPELASPISVPLAAVLVVAALVTAASAPDRPDETAYPSGALASVRQDRGVLLNEYDWGGYLIFNTPERAVFIDGRYVPYIGEVLDDYRDLVALRPSWRDLLARYRIDEALLRTTRPLAVALREDGWRVRAQDARGGWVLLARP